MLTQRKIKQVKKLLARWKPQTVRNRTTFSLHDIAKQTGLSYSAVYQVRTGKFGKVEKVEDDNGLFNVDEFKNWLTGNAQ